MMETKWTPGPWVKDGIAIAHMSPPHGYPLDVCLMGEPAQYAGDTATMLQNCDANARLIAAAPDLYAALAPLIVIALDNLEFMPTETREECERDIATARAALAKARGEA